MRGRLAGHGGQKTRFHGRTLPGFVNTLGFTLCEIGSHCGPWNLKVALICLLQRLLAPLLRTDFRRTERPKETT